MKKTYQPTFSGALSIILFLVVTMGISVLWLDIPIHITMLVAAAFAVGVILYEGNKWEKVMEYIEYGGKIAIAPTLVLMIIGTVMGSWIASGTVPLIIYWGLKLISPSMFLVTACIVCGITSLATGSSWSTGGTVGVALMAVGSGLGINPAMTAGAIISGSYFGDKLSPLSDTTNLSPAVAEADLFDHIKSMFYTTIPALIISLIIYGIIGTRYAGDALNSEAITTTINAIHANFNLNIIVLIPAIIVIVMATKKVPAIPTLIISSFVATLIAIFIQGETVTTITKIMDSGFVSNTGIAEIDRLLSRGGLQNMLWTASLGVIGIAYGAILEKSGILEVLLSKIKSFIKTTGGLVSTTVLSLIGLNFATASQYMSIVLGGRMFISAYKEKDMLPQTLSRTLEDAGTLFSVMVPWNLCGVFFAGTLGVSTIAYAPYALLNWICPLIAIIYGFMNKFQWKTGEIPSKRTYRDEHSAA